ncbi:uncharacterized protein LOC133030771 [Cannabis sativa]|uniref:uncharacterized protein LOC133030771 n=1 Tax=Cannabis sativa TaxID=3483 RepID=UPI0029CA71D4|nr:uncharacterized protein LOC133030771 [Cannabis sativa]XP_060959627.1 uncharacterized protein LOC133030771 [Cannabis sativa]
MESGDNMQHTSNSKKGGRRTWTILEEEALLVVLESCVLRGYRCDGGFKAGTYPLIEKELRFKCPNSGLKASPHIESKIKIWKKQYSIVFDMLNVSRFGWNEILKCIQVDSDEVWNAYVQSHKEADGWRGKQFPIYDRLANIFGADRATGKAAETPADMAKAVDLEDDYDGNEMQEETSFSPMSVNQSSGNQSQSGRKKRARPGSDICVGLEKLAKSLDNMMEKSHEETKLLIETLKNRDNNKMYDSVWEEITKMNLHVADQIKALKIFAEQPWNVSALKNMDEATKIEFVMTLINHGFGSKDIKI